MPNYKRKYSEEKLIYFLRKLAIELGRTPKRIDMDMTVGFPNSTTYQTNFGSWTEALIKSGLKPNRIGRYNKEELIRKLRTFSFRYGKPTERKLGMENNMPRYGSYKKYFGSLNQAVIESRLVLKE